MLDKLRNKLINFLLDEDETISLEVNEDKAVIECVSRDVVNFKDVNVFMAHPDNDVVTKYVLKQCDSDTRLVTQDQRNTLKLVHSAYAQDDRYNNRQLNIVLSIPDIQFKYKSICITLDDSYNSFKMELPYVYVPNAVDDNTDMVNYIVVNGISHNWDADKIVQQLMEKTHMSEKASKIRYSSIKNAVDLFIGKTPERATESYTVSVQQIISESKDPPKYPKIYAMCRRTLSAMSQTSLHSKINWDVW